ncbi:MAG: 30S ribosomal protein S5 [Parachlamydiales bacterium]|nr:30S ribosomal protein S5 [Parachlamydiales bacterium]
MAKETQDSEFEEKVLYINRCSKVVKGGRKFSFSALILIGNLNGKVGYGFAKANEVADAIRKGSEAAKKNVITFDMNDGTIPHEIHVSHDGAKLLMKPAPEGTGVIAGGKIRSVFELAGIRNIVAKSQGSSNPINQVRATFKALRSLMSREKSLKERGLE